MTIMPEIVAAPASPIREIGRLALSGETWSTPAILGDGGRTLVIATDRRGWIRAFDGADLSLAWARDLGAEITASPVIAALDRDGRPAIAIGTHGGDLHVIAADGRTIWRRHFRDVIRSTAAVADVDGSGRLTLFVGVYGPFMVALDGDGGERWRRRLPNHLFAGSMKRGIVSSPLVADVDRDGRAEVVIGIRSSRLFCLDALDGQIKWFTKLAYDPDSTASATVDAGGRPLVLVGGGEHTSGIGDNAVIALDGRDGRRVWTTEVGGGVDSSPMLLDRPGRSPLVFACSLARPSVLGLDAWSGRLLWRHDFGPTAGCTHGADGQCRPVGGRYFTEHAICRSYTTPLIADLDGRGRFDIVAGSNNGALVVLDAETGALRAEVDTGAMVRGSAVIADLDGDGFGELVVASGDHLIVHRTHHTGPETTMFKVRPDHLGTRDTPAPLAEPHRRAPRRFMGLRLFWHFGVVDAARHAALKLDEKVLRRFGLRLFRYGY